MQWSENAWLLQVYFLSLRLAAILVLTPILYASNLPSSFRIILVLTLSVAIAAGISPQFSSVKAIPPDVLGIILISIKELILGATLAIGIFVAFASISVAGRILDIQIGFGMAQIFDPLTQQQLPVLTSAFNHIGVIFFFLIDAHHTLLRAVAFSIDHFPLGASWDISIVAVPLLKQIGLLFSLGFALASPIIFCLLLVELALGVVARNLPQMNMFMMGVPIKIVVGLITLSIWFVAMGDVLRRIHNSIFQSWNWIFTANSQLISQVTSSGVLHV